MRELLSIFSGVLRDAGRISFAHTSLDAFLFVRWSIAMLFVGVNRPFSSGKLSIFIVLEMTQKKDSHFRLLGGDNSSGK